MNWQSVREAYPNQWLIIEAINAYTNPDHLRVIDQLRVVEQCSDGTSAFQRYRVLHTEYPEREFYFVRTSRKVLKIREVQWLGVRGIHAAYPER